MPSFLVLFGATEVAPFPCVVVLVGLESRPFAFDLFLSMANSISRVPKFPFKDLQRGSQRHGREGHEFTRAGQAPIRIAASAAEGHVSSLNPGKAEPYRNSDALATTLAITGF